MSLDPNKTFCVVIIDYDVRTGGERGPFQYERVELESATGLTEDEAHARAQDWNEEHGDRRPNQGLHAEVELE